MEHWSLIPDWKLIWKRAWSVRLALLAALLSGIEVAVGVWATGNPPIFAGIAFVASLGAGIARIVAQPKLHE